MNSTRSRVSQIRERVLMMRALLVGNRERTGRSVGARLSREGFTIQHVQDAQRVVARSLWRTCDVVIVLDERPVLDGLRLCRDLRLSGCLLPVLMTSTRAAVADRVKGLDSGADDYLCVPFAMPELAARVRALLRRNGHTALRPLEIGDLSLDPLTRKVHRDGRHIDLTPKEFAILECLIRRPGVPVSRAAIAGEAWGKRWDGLTNEIDVFISRLRRKVERTGRRRLFYSVRGVGYALSSGPGEARDDLSSPERDGGND